MTDPVRAMTGYIAVNSLTPWENSGMSGMSDRFKSLNYLKSDGSEQRIHAIASRLSRCSDCSDSHSRYHSLPEDLDHLTLRVRHDRDPKY